MHILDIGMYIILAIILWSSLRDEYKHELGAIAGFLVMVIYTVIYLILFAVVDYNWIDIFTYLGGIEIKTIL